VLRDCAWQTCVVDELLALTSAQARVAITAAEAAGVALAVGFNRRFLPAYQTLITMYSNGDLEQALHVEENFSDGFG